MPDCTIVTFATVESGHVCVQIALLIWCMHLYRVAFLTARLGLARFGVSGTIYVNVDSPNLGFTYLNVLGGGQLKKHPVS